MSRGSVVGAPRDGRRTRPSRALRSRRAPAPRRSRRRGRRRSAGARSASASGVRWLAGAFWRSRAAVLRRRHDRRPPDRPRRRRGGPTRARPRGPPAGPRAGGGSGRSGRRAAAVPSTRPPTTAVADVMGHLPAEGPRPSSRARPWTRRRGDPRPLRDRTPRARRGRPGSSAGPRRGPGRACGTRGAPHRRRRAPAASRRRRRGRPARRRTARRRRCRRRCRAEPSVVASKRIGGAGYRAGSSSMVGPPDPRFPGADMPKTVILSAARTPIGKLGGGLAALDATELGGIAIEAALERADVDPEQVEHVVFGQVLQAGQGQIPSRQAQIKGGIPKEVSSETINKVCASGLRAARHPRPGDPRRGRRGRGRRAGWSRCRTRPTCCRRRASATGWATRRRSTR